MRNYSPIPSTSRRKEEREPPATAGATCLDRTERRGRTLISPERLPPAPLALLDEEGRVACVSPAWCELSGLPASGMEDRAAADLFDAGALVEERTRALAPGERWSGELGLVRADGGVLPVRATAMRTSGEPARYWLALRDVSREKELDARLRGAEERLDALVAALHPPEKAFADVSADKVREEVQDELARLVTRMADEGGEAARRDLCSAALACLERMGLAGPQAETGAGAGPSPRGDKAADCRARLLGLTPTEVEVCRLVLARRSSKEIAETLHSAYDTVQTHRKNIRRKLGLRGEDTSLYAFLRGCREALGD